MAQNFWLAIVAWTVCFVVTIVVSLFTAPRPDKELVGLVYALTEKPQEGHLTWYQRPAGPGIARAAHDAGAELHLLSEIARRFRT